MRKKSKLNSEKIWKIQKKGKLNSEKIRKIWKKGKLNSEKIWIIWKISVLVIITPKETSSSLPPALLLPAIPLVLLLYIHCFSELRRIILE
jgi:hypothetical protein